MKKSDLLYDYIKFHLGLYLATPPIMSVVATCLSLEKQASFKLGLLIMIVIYLFSGAHASWFIASHINVKWTADKNWISFGKSADNLFRRTMHHYLYWLGLIAALTSIVVALLYPVDVSKDTGTDTINIVLRCLSL
ncbi:hypothetical protein EA58_01170 [Photobacterium galatheae]|uniref:Uncharacterized protein n=2 Tax=Photobacterium galatheae TaxID=1654360 RepID=A0A066RWL3_9GAMM|nr:hypothetical protein EA58_01170 [Photobacterium galatheae]